MSFWSPVLNQTPFLVLRTFREHFTESKQNLTPSLPALQNPTQACSPVVPNCSTYQVYEHCMRNANISLHLGKHWHRKLFFSMLTAGSLNKSSVSPRVGEEGKKVLILKICHQQHAITRDTVHVSLKYGALK